VVASAGQQFEHKLDPMPLHQEDGETDLIDRRTKPLALSSRSSAASPNPKTRACQPVSHSVCTNL
jgi:hypothetical protein